MKRLWEIIIFAIVAGKIEGIYAISNSEMQSKPQNMKSGDYTIFLLNGKNSHNTKR